MPDTIKVTHPDHGELEVPAPEGWVSPDSLETEYVPRASVEARIREAKRNATRGLAKPEDLMEDEDFRRKLAESHEDWFRETLSVKPGKDVDVEKIRAQILETEVGPREEKLKGQSQEIQRLRRKERDGDARAAMVTAGLKAQYQPLALALARERTAWNEDHQGWFVVAEGTADVDEPEWLYAQNPEQGRAPFQDLAEFFKQLRASGEFPDWWDPKSKPGSDYKGGEGGTSDVTLEQFEKMTGPERTKLYHSDPDTWRRLMAEQRAAREKKYADVSSA